MELQPLGKTGLMVSPLGFGAGHVGGDNMSDGEAGRLLNAVLDEGVNFIDTARGYGLSEERIGRHLSERRSEFVLCSKCGYGIEGLDPWTPESVCAGVDEALTRLQTDVIDVMLLHSCPRNVLQDFGAVEALLEAVEAGKVRFAGYSGENRDLAHSITIDDFRVFETSVNLFDQGSLNAAIPSAAERGCGIIAKRPLGNAPWRFDERPDGHYGEIYWDRMQHMNLSLADDMSWDELALRFTAHAPGVSTAIAGTSQLDNLKRNVSCVDQGPLDPECIAAIRSAWSAHGSDWPGQV